MKVEQQLRIEVCGRFVITTDWNPVYYHKYVCELVKMCADITASNPQQIITTRSNDQTIKEGSK